MTDSFLRNNVCKYKMSTNKSKKGGGVFGKSKTEKELEILKRDLKNLQTEITNINIHITGLPNKVATLEGEVAKLKGHKEAHGSEEAKFIHGVTPPNMMQNYSGIIPEVPEVPEVPEKQGGRKMKKKGKKFLKIN